MATRGEKIRQAREELGATLEELAAWSGLPAETIAAIEAGQPFSATTFEALCRGLAINPHDILSGPDRDPHRSIAWFRTQIAADAAAATKPLAAADLRLLKTAAAVGSALGFLCELLGEKPRILSMRKLVPLDSREEPFWQGYLLGSAARLELEAKPGPIPSLRAYLEGLGVHIVEVPFSNRNIEGASLWPVDGLPIILLNQQSKRVQYSLSRRAILAHELCHLLHDGGEAEALARLTLKAGPAGYTDQVEQRARGFAPAFLAPISLVRKWWRKKATAALLTPKELALKLAGDWGLSYEGAVFHAANCHLIKKTLIADLMAHPPRGENRIAQRFEVETEPDPPEISPFFRGLARKLVERAALGLLISEGRKRELLAWR